MKKTFGYLFYLLSLIFGLITVVSFFRALSSVFTKPWDDPYNVGYNLALVILIVFFAGLAFLFFKLGTKLTGDHFNKETPNINDIGKE